MKSSEDINPYFQLVGRSFPTKYPPVPPLPILRLAWPMERRRPREILSSWNAVFHNGQCPQFRLPLERAARCNAHQERRANGFRPRTSLGAQKTMYCVVDKAQNQNELRPFHTQSSFKSQSVQPHFAARPSAASLPFHSALQIFILYFADIANPELGKCW